MSTVPEPTNPTIHVVGPTTTPVDDLVAEYLDLADRIQVLTAQQDNLRARLRDLGPGRHPTSSGLTVTVTPPSRRFNLDRAWEMLTVEQQTVCVAPDPRKVKAQLPPALTELCMEPGTGNPVVKVG